MSCLITSTSWSCVRWTIWAVGGVIRGCSLTLGGKVGPDRHCLFLVDPRADIMTASQLTSRLSNISFSTSCPPRDYYRDLYFHNHQEPHCRIALAWRQLRYPRPRPPWLCSSRSGTASARPSSGDAAALSRLYPSRQDRWEDLCVNGIFMVCWWWNGGWQRGLFLDWMRVQWWRCCLVDVLVKEILCDGRLSV